MRPSRRPARQSGEAKHIRQCDREASEAVHLMRSPMLPLPQNNRQREKRR
jgi:hypothetical protein